MSGEIENQASPELGGGKKKNKWLYLIIGVVVIAMVAIAFAVLKPKSSTITDEAGGIANTDNAKVAEVDTSTDKPVYDPQQYSWSTMNKGPYNDKISYATSNNLLTWNDSGTTLAEHASVPDVVLKDGVLYAYFVDVSTDGYPEKIGMVKSIDNGKSWTSREFIDIKGIGQKAPADPAPILLSDGRIRLFYFDILEGKLAKGRKTTNKIYSAISTDGANFVQEAGVRFEYDGIFDPDVIKISDSLWRMYVGNQDGLKVLSATSTDGLAFTYEGVAYSGSAIPNVVYENETYYLFTGGIDISSSKDGETFAKTSNRFTLRDKLVADPGVVKLGANSYLMVYKTKEMKPSNQPTKSPTGN